MLYVMLSQHVGYLSCFALSYCNLTSHCVPVPGPRETNKAAVGCGFPFPSLSPQSATVPY